MYLESKDSIECFGCEACVQICEKKALTMIEDEEGFRYPSIDKSLCVNCSRCRKVCPYDNMPQKFENNKYIYGGYNNNPKVRFDSTSGGAFSAIVDAFCDENYAIFGAEAKGLLVFHNCIVDKQDLWRFRKSKYSQSIIGSSYLNARKFLKDGKKVLFSGTPCQIAGLLAFLANTDMSNLLTIEVVCEGIPSPLYVRKIDKAIEKKYGLKIEELDYRYTGKSIFLNGKWDFEKMRIQLGSAVTNDGAYSAKEKVIVKDRWFNPFWSIWLQHLMSRPSCYQCAFTTKGRVADITLGDLWGVHLYCPELYGKNGGSSLVICNTEKGKALFNKAKENMYGHDLDYEEAVRYQGPLKRPISNNPKRSAFISDLQSEMDLRSINKKWAETPTIKLLFQKYIWGNRQKIFFWNLKNFFHH